jgi:signal transduction histidine kinase/ligand-binding sensor domain-containing protein/AraC-like DNA-binding protein
MDFRLVRIILFIIVIACTQFVFGQKIRFYNSEQGLPNSLIHKVSQDALGYIWIATENGASYFDGVRFTTFRHDQAQPGSIANDLVKVIFTDSKGVTWVGTSDGLQIFDRNKNNFENFHLQCPEFKLTPYITSIVESKLQQRLYVSVSGYGIMVYDINTHILDKETTDNLNNCYQNSYLGNFFLDSEETIWSHSEQGNFLRLNLKKNRLEEINWSSELKNISNKIFVSAIVEDPFSRNILIGTYNHGLFIYDRSLNQIRKPRGLNQQPIRIRSLLAERMDGNTQKSCIWVGTEDSGLKQFDTSKENIVSPDFEYAAVDLENCKVHSMIQDIQGNIWVGIFQKGLLIIPRLSNRFDYIKLSESRSSIATNIACVTSIRRDQQNNLWVGTDGGGLFKIGDDRKVFRYTFENTPLLNNAVLSLSVGKNGSLWISTYMGGVTIYNTKSGFQTFSNDKEFQKVICSVYDKWSDCLYFGTLGHGVKVYSYASNTIKSLDNISEHKWTNSFSFDKNGILLIGHTGGLCFYDTRTGQETSFDISEKIKGYTISVSLVDTKGNYWLGSSKGLFFINTTTREVKLFTKSDGLPSNSVCAILEDENQEFWISTMNGISHFDPAQNQFKNYYLSDGLQDNEFRMKASYKDHDGKLYFGGINGISSFYPGNIKNEDKIASKIFFSDLMVLNRKVDYNDSSKKNKIIEKHISQATQITLKKSQNVFSINFTVLEFANPNKVIYCYMLKGFDKEWQYTGSNHRMATYTNIPHGKYTLMVKAFFEGNTNEENIASNEIGITILPPLHKSWWAYLIYLSLAMLAFWEIQNFFLRKRVRFLERLEYEKKEMKLHLFADISHEIRTPLSIVLDPIKSMRKAETDNKRREMLDFMYRNVLRVMSLLNQIVDIRKSDSQQFEMQFQKIDIFELLRDVMKSFDQLALLRNIDFRIVSNFTLLEVGIDIVNFDKVIFNILSNAFKFTPKNGFIMINVDSYKEWSGQKSTETEVEYIEICIENSGENIYDQEIDRVFDRFFQSKNNSRGGSGIGLHLARKIVELHSGTISAHNVDNGVAFILKIPVRRELFLEENLQNSVNESPRVKLRPDVDNSNAKQVVSSQNEIYYHFNANETPARSVIVIDNDIDWGNYLRMELSSKYNVEICNDPKEAWKCIISSMPDAVITDIMLNDTDGLSLCKKIKENPETNHIPVIILSSLTDEQSECMSFSLGADHFLSKPISLDLLVTTIDQAIKTRITLRNRFRNDLDNNFEHIRMISSDNKLISKVIETIRKNLDNADFSVDELSAEVGLSRVHLNRKLKENLNISPGNLIKSIRLKQAAYLLVNNKLNVSEVAFKLGYSSHSYFSNIFKEYFGMSPTEFIAKFSESDTKENLTKIFDV